MPRGSYAVAATLVFRNCARIRRAETSTDRLHGLHGDATERAGDRESMSEWLGNDTSFVAGIRLIECSIQVNNTSGFGVGYALLE